MQSSVALTARYPLMQLACVRARNWLRRRLLAKPIYVAYINATTRAFCAEGLHFSAFHYLSIEKYVGRYNYRAS